MHRSRHLAVLVALGLLGGCASPGAQPPAETAAATPASTASETSQDADPAVRAETPSARTAAVDVPIQDTGLDALTPGTDHAPVQVRYTDRGIDLEVDPVGVAADGQMQIPDDAERAGWYRHGPGAGAERGTVVIAAHNGSFDTGRGPFHNLRDADPGEPITLIRSDGTEVTYEVLTVTGEPKDTIDLAEYFRRDGEPQLVLITCGGQWDSARQSYTDNVVVTAMLRAG